MHEDAAVLFEKNTDAGFAADLVGFIRKGKLKFVMEYIDVEVFGVVVGVGGECFEEEEKEEGE